MKTKRIIATLTLFAAITVPAVCGTPAMHKATPATDQKSTTTVYVTKKGKKYHKANCSKLNVKKVFSLKRYEAEERGYQPCKRCHTSLR